MNTISRMLVVFAVLAGGCYAGAEVDAIESTAAPRSLAGTDVDGALRASAGAFVFDEQARRAFDYFLTADGELSAAALDGWVRGELARRLPAEAVEDGFAAWRSYVEYRGAAAAVLADPAVELADAERRLQALVAAELGDYPIAADERAAVSRAFKIKRAQGLAEAERERVLADLDDAEAFAASEAGQFLAGRQAVALVQASGGAADAVQAARSEQFGGEAADRLAALDARRVAWARRVEAFRADREALLAGSAGTEAQRVAKVAALAASRFTPAELRRVEALDRLAAPDERRID